MLTWVPSDLMYTNGVVMKDYLHAAFSMCCTYGFSCRLLKVVSQTLSPEEYEIINIPRDFFAYQYTSSLVCPHIVACFWVGVSLLGRQVALFVRVSVMVNRCVVATYVSGCDSLNATNYDIIIKLNATATFYVTLRESHAWNVNNRYMFSVYWPHTVCTVSSACEEEPVLCKMYKPLLCIAVCTDLAWILQGQYKLLYMAPVHLSSSPCARGSG